MFDAFPLVANEFEIDLGFLGYRRSMVENKRFLCFFLFL